MLSRSFTITSEVGRTLVIFSGLVMKTPGLKCCSYSKSPSICLCHCSYKCTIISSRISLKDARMFIDNSLCVCVLNHVWLFATPWSVAPQALLSMDFSRQEYWSKFPFSPLGYLLDPGIQPRLLHLLHWQVEFLLLAPPGKPHHCPYRCTIISSRNSLQDERNVYQQLFR